MTRPLSNSWTNEELQLVDLNKAMLYCAFRVQAAKSPEMRSYWVKLYYRCSDIYMDFVTY